MALLTTGLSIAVTRHYDAKAYGSAISVSISMPLCSLVYKMQIVGDFFHNEDVFACVEDDCRRDVRWNS